MNIKSLVATKRLSLIFSLVIACIDVFAYDFEVDGIFYNKLTESSVEVTASDNDYSGIISIPPSININGYIYNVTAIGVNAFSFNHELVSVTLPNSIKEIRNYAFYGTSGLTEIEIPASVISIGSEALHSSSMQNIYVDKWNTIYCDIDGVLFTKDKKILCQYPSGRDKDYTIPNTCTSIHENAFSVCSLTSVVIPQSVTTIQHGNFIGCDFLENIFVDRDNMNWCDIDGVLYTKNKQLLKAFPGGRNSYTVPEGCIIIGESAFSQIEIHSVALPSTLLYIAPKAFMFCPNLKSIIIPKSVGAIDNWAFCYSGLESVLSKIEEPFPVKNVFDDTMYTGVTLEVPVGTKKLYESTSEWNKFEKIIEVVDGKEYQINITASGNGSVMYNSSAVRNSTQSFIVSEGTSATVSITPDNGYKIASLYVNNINMTSGIANNSYTINNISKNTTVEVTFEAIPVTTYSLSITASGNGSVTYNSTAVRNKTQSFTVNGGTSATVSITPDNGYKIASLYVNNINMTSGITDNSYTINNISKNTTVEVTFEAIPVTTYSLSITASGKGSVTYNSTAVRNKTQSFTVNEGTSAIVSITPDNGYRVASLYVNNINMTSGITDNSYTINNISKNTTVEVTFEAIPVTTYSLSITASGNGSVTYNSTAVRNKTQSFTVSEGTSAIVSITPDNGYKIASLYVNNINMTSSIANNSYTVSNIKKNTTITVSFEVETPSYDITQYVSAISIGGAYTQTNDLINSGSQLNWQFTNKSAYSVTLKSMQLIDGKSGKGGNIMNVDKQVAAGSSVSYSTTIGVLGIYLPVTCHFKYEYNNVEYSTDAVFAGSPKYTMSIKSTGNGSVRYSGMTVRNETKTFTVDNLSSVAITFSPDSGNRLKSVKVNNKDVTSSVSNNSYTERFVTGNLDVEVEFETIQTTTLNITVSGNGSITYNKTVVRDETQSFSVNEGDNATILFSPDKGYNIKNVKINNNDITAEISNNSYTVKNITDLVVLNVQFENLVDSLDNELRTLNNQLGRVRSRQIELERRLNKLSIEYKDNADAVKQISQLNQKLTNCFVAIFNLQTRIDSFGSSLVDGYNKGELTSSFKKEELEEIKRDLDALLGELDEVEKEIDELVNSQPFVCDGVSFMHVPNDEQKVVVSTGDYGHVLRVPATVTQNGTTWTVAGIETDALKDNTELAAVVWEPSVAFTATVSNPNLLLYVKSANYAPAAIKNVVVNGVANSITLTDAASGNSFYCAQSFTARTISYQHTYGMTTGIGESRGWETISLPFDVQNISHKTKGDIVPFAQWNGGEAFKPFWLYELTGIGFVEASNIKAYTPYIISMPNNGRYDSQWQLSGTVTFSASNVVVDETENLHTAFYLDRTFVPNFTEKGASEGLYALNVNNDYSTDNSGMPEGSKFVLNMRPVHPFEAYMTTASNARQMIDIFEGMTTEITGIYEIPSEKGPTYDLQGRKVAGVKKGVYIKDGRKVIIK